MGFGLKSCSGRSPALRGQTYDLRFSFEQFTVIRWTVLRMGMNWFKFLCDDLVQLVFNIWAASERTLRGRHASPFHHISLCFVSPFHVHGIAIAASGLPIILWVLLPVRLTLCEAVLLCFSTAIPIHRMISRMIQCCRPFSSYRRWNWEADHAAVLVLWGCLFVLVLLFCFWLALCLGYLFCLRFSVGIVTANKTLYRSWSSLICN